MTHAYRKLEACVMQAIRIYEPSLPEDAALASLQANLNTSQGDRTFIVHAPDADAGPYPPGVACKCDGRVWMVGDATYLFSRRQSLVMKALLEAWRRGDPFISRAEVAAEAGIEHHRIDTLFRPNGPVHPAWGTLIERVGRGLYRLNVSAAAQAASS